MTASFTGIPASVGTVSANTGNTVHRLIPTESNDLTHVSNNPDQGRVVMRRPDGHFYTSTPFVQVASGLRLIKEAE